MLASSSARRGVLGAGLLFIFLAYFWVVSHGTWRLFGQEEFGQFFDYQALSFVHGRLDVPAEAVGNEAFVYHGKTYGYWGPFPAFLRLPLAVFGPGPWIGHTARASCLLAAMITVISLGGIAGEIASLAARPPRRWITGVTLLALAFGSPLLFLLSWSYVFHEVLLWAGALAHLSAWLGLRHLRTGSLRSLLGTVASAAAAGLTRPTLGYGAILGAALVTSVTVLAAWRGRGPLWLEPRRPLKVLGLAAALALAGILPLAYNYVRFDEVSPPFKYYALSDTRRLASIDGGKVIQPGNLLANVRAYFDPRQLTVTWRFPFFYLKSYLPDPAHHQKIDHLEPFAGLAVTMTGALALGVVGLGFCARHLRALPVVAGAAASAVLICMFTTLTERYLHDFLPLISLLALMGAAALRPLPRWPARCAGLVLILLSAFSVAEFAAFTLVFQRVTAVNAQEARAEFEKFTDRIDRRVDGWRDRLFGLPLPIIDVPDWQHLPPPRAGAIARRLDPPGLLWHDGKEWRLVSGSCDEIIHLRLEVALPEADVPSSEPVLTVGKPDLATLISLRCDGPGQWSATCEIWGASYRQSPRFTPDRRTFPLEIVIDRINERIVVRREQTTLLDLHAKTHAFAGLPLHLGENPFGGSFTSARFTGQLRKIEPND